MSIFIFDAWKKMRTTCAVDKNKHYAVKTKQSSDTKYKLNQSINQLISEFMIKIRKFMHNCDLCMYSISSFNWLIDDLYWVLHWFYLIILKLKFCLDNLVIACSLNVMGNRLFEVPFFLFGLYILVYPTTNEYQNEHNVYTHHNHGLRKIRRHDENL